MKTLLLFLALLASLTANAQQKTWGGTTAVLYPNMATGFKIYSNGSFSISSQTNKLSMSSGVLLLDGSAIPAAAGTLTGSTLASGVTASSLTSVGTLGSLTVTAPISGSVTGSSGTVTTNANLTGPITSVGNATAIASQTGTGTKFVVDTSPTLITPTLGVASSTSESITGTDGNGYLGIVAQSSAPSAPAGGYRLYADSSGRFSWIRPSDGFTRTFDATLTTNRVYTLPDASMTFARTDAAQTFTGTQTISGEINASGTVVSKNNLGTTLNSYSDFQIGIGSGVGIFLSPSYQIAWTGVGGAGSSVYANTRDLYIARKSAANLRQGAADAAAPVAQSHSVQSVVAGTSNTAGANRTFEGSIGTGTGTGGSIIFQTAPAGSTGTAQNSLVTALTISGEGNLVQPVAKTYSVATGTNQRAGNAVLVGGTVTVTNSTVTANTIVMHARKTIGGTVGNMSYTTSAGASFTINSSSGTDTSTISYFLIENP